jgi:hypothetical protein
VPLTRIGWILHCLAHLIFLVSLLRPQEDYNKPIAKPWGAQRMTRTILLVSTKWSALALAEAIDGQGDLFYTVFKREGHILPLF